MPGQQIALRKNARPKNVQGPHINKNYFNFFKYFFRYLALQRISYLVIFIVSECKGTLKMFNYCKCEKNNTSTRYEKKTCIE